MISIVIPAHNEAGVIESCLSSLTDALGPGEAEILVVCNGCSDDTSELARSFGDPVRVVETEVPSKSNALNLGDEAAVGFPRFYIDADIVLSVDTIRAVAKRLDDEKILAAAPKPIYDVSESSRPVRAFYRTWFLNSYFDSGMIGSGVYALSEEGRKRFDRFPDIIADDGYVRLQFKPDEREVVEEATFRIKAPKRFSGLIAIKTRSRFGTAELGEVFPELLANEIRRGDSNLVRVLKTPSVWLDAPFYYAVILVSRIRSSWRLRFGNRKIWDRDESARSGDSG